MSTQFKVSDLLFIEAVKFAKLNVQMNQNFQKQLETQ